MAVRFRIPIGTIVLATILTVDICTSFRIPVETISPILDINISEKSSQNRTETLSPSQACPWCRGFQAAPTKDETLTDNDIRQLRLELVKAKILSRLNLAEAPKGIKERNRFPSLVTEGRVPGASIYDTEISSSDDPVLPSIVVADSKIPCLNNIKVPSSCFKFQLDPLPGLESMRKEAQLWLWKLHYEGDETPQLITVSQMKRTSNSEHQDRLLSYDVTNTTVGWISINITWTQASLNGSSDNPYLYLRISCPNCHGRRTNSPFSNKYDHRPFLVTKDDIPQLHSNDNRVRRTTGECSDRNARCCRDSLYVDFKELGWDTWILQPPGFTMYYCRGSCNYASANSTARAGNTYIGLLHRLMLRPNISTSLRNALSPCCAAGHKDALSVLWVNGTRSSARVSKLQDMIVKSCDCFG